MGVGKAKGLQTEAGYCAFSSMRLRQPGALRIAANAALAVQR